MVNKCRTLSIYTKHHVHNGNTIKYWIDESYVIIQNV